MHDVVLTIVGSDRPGLVEAVAEGRGPCRRKLA